MDCGQTAYDGAGAFFRPRRSACCAALAPAQFASGQGGWDSGPPLNRFRPRSSYGGVAGPLVACGGANHQDVAIVFPPGVVVTDPTPT